MAKYLFTVVVDVDEEALAGHDDKEGPPSHDVMKWYATDLILAVNEAFAEVDHAECQSIVKLDD